MLGSAFFKTLSGDADFEIFAFSREDLDICDYDALVSLFSKISPDFVINCAAYTAVDDCEDHRELAFKVNGEALEVIAKACKAENCRLIHFSTDYVFDGRKAEGYLENDAVNPINAYGESKLLGEQNIAKNMDEYFIIRTSWLFGDNGKNFVGTMIRLSKERDSLKVVNDQIGSPTYTMDLCFYVIDNFLRPFFEIREECHARAGIDHIDFDRESIDFGIYHVTNSGSASWFDFAKAIFEAAGIKINVEPISSDQFPAKAIRPKYSILLNSKIPARMRDWREAMEVYLKLAS